MSTLDVFNISGLNLKLNPFSHRQGELTRAINVTNDFFGGKAKRPGYITFLNAADATPVNSLFSWKKNDGTTLFLYRASGSALYYSIQGTGNWTLCGNGTISNGAHVGYAVLENTLIVGDGVGSTRHTTNGSDFTNTTNAPIAASFAEYNQRIFAAGTASNLFWSTTGTPTDWTTDSSSVLIPGAGKLSTIFKQNNRLIACKNARTMFKYDGVNLFDLSTNLGPSSPYSVAAKEDLRFSLTEDGMTAFDGLKPQIISNPVQRMIYNNKLNGIPGTSFETAPAEVHRYEYMVAVGTITDDFTERTINDAILVYDIQANEFYNWQFAHNPTAWHSYRDVNGDLTLMFGDKNGNTYEVVGTATSDAGSAITVEMEGFLHFGAPQHDKNHRWLTAFSSPGAQAEVHFSLANTFLTLDKAWQPLGNLTSGVFQKRFPEGSDSKFLFWRVTERSKSPGFKFFGFSWEGEIESQRIA